MSGGGGGIIIIDNGIVNIAQTNEVQSKLPPECHAKSTAICAKGAGSITDGEFAYLLACIAMARSGC
jgi:hypothetical protein